MEELLNKKIEMIISEPWDYPDNIKKIIIERLLLDSRNNTFFITKDLKNEEIFVISGRYVGNDLKNITKLEKPKRITVNISRPREIPYIINENNIEENLIFFAIGSAELIEE